MFSNLWISLEFTQTILTCQKDAILKIHCKYKCHIQIVYVLKNVDSLVFTRYVYTYFGNSPSYLTWMKVCLRLLVLITILGFADLP